MIESSTTEIRYFAGTIKNLFPYEPLFSVINGVFVMTDRSAVVLFRTKIADGYYTFLDGVKTFKKCKQQDEHICPVKLEVIRKASNFNTVFFCTPKTYYFGKIPSVIDPEKVVAIGRQGERCKCYYKHENECSAVLFEFYDGLSVFIMPLHPDNCRKKDMLESKPVTKEDRANLIIGVQNET